MAIAIPDMWQALNLDIVAPETILKRQVEYLQSKGKGVLSAELTMVTGTLDFVIHRLDLIASQLHGQRYRVLVATHRSEYYPVQIEADCYRPKTRTYSPEREIQKLTLGLMPTSLHGLSTDQQTEALTWPPENDWRAIARDQDDFLDKLQTILRSAEVRSVMDSFIARTNELQLVNNERSQPETTSNGQ